MKRTKEKESIVLLLLGVLLFFAGSIITYDSTSIENNKNNIVVDYKSFGDIEYNFRLKDNFLYKDEYINKNKILAKYIDYIDLKFTYDLTSINLIDSEAEYSISLFLVNTYKDGLQTEELWKREDVLFPKNKVIKQETGVVFFDYKTTIDYKEYQEEALEFRKESSILTEAYIKVVFEINNLITTKETAKKVADLHTMTAKIPLLDTVVSVDKTGSFNENKNVFSKDNIVNQYGLTIGIFLVMVSFVLFFYYLKRVLHLKNADPYTKERDRILTTYANVIAEVAKKPDLSKFNVMDITNVKDLIDIEDELRIPILFFESKRKRESTFIIIHENKAYRYVLNEKALIM